MDFSVIKELRPKKQGYRLELFEINQPIVIREFRYIQEARELLKEKGFLFKVGGSDGPLRGAWECWQRG